MPPALLALLLSLLAGLAAAGPGPVHAEAPDPNAPGLTDGQRLRALLERVQHEQAAMKSLVADFTMRQESDLLAEEEESQGRFLYAAPDRVRWDYADPRAMTVVVDEGEMTTWFRDLGRAEVAEVGRYSDRFLKYMSAASSLGTLLESFDARVRFDDEDGGPYRIELTPKYRRIARRVKTITLWIDRDRYLPARVRFETAGGEVTDFQFADVVVNGDLPAEAFRLELPPEVEVDRVQLGGGETE